MRGEDKDFLSKSFKSYAFHFYNNFNIGNY